MDPCCLWIWALLTGAALGCKRGKSGWSMHVAQEKTGLRGNSIVLPCNFTYPGSSYTGEIRVIWKLKTDGQSPAIFQCRVRNDSASDSSNNCTARPDPSGRYSLAGDPRRHDLSMRIAGLDFSNSGNYMCRVELTEEPGCDWQDPSGTRLTVEATPTIRNLSLLSGSFPWRVACIAEGKPLPNITWLGPPNSMVRIELPTTAGPNFEVTQEATVSWNGTCTCRAENVHGQAERSLVLGPKKMPPSLLLASLLSAALILLLIVLLLVLGWRWRGRCPVPRRAPGASVGLHHDAPETEGRKNMGSAQPGEMETCPPYQPPTHIYEPSPAPAENLDSCTYADLAFPNAGVGASRSSHQPEAQHPSAPAEEVTYSDLTLHK